jgi:hypothetical protein
VVWGQKDFIDKKPLEINVNAIDLTLSTLMGDGGMASQYSWNLTGYQAEETEEWFFPQDQYMSNMLFHLYNIICYDDSGYVDRSGVRHERVWIRSEGFHTDYTWERRRYAPPAITVDGTRLDSPYEWEVDPSIPTEMVASFEDIYRNIDLIPDYGGIRVKVNIYAMSNSNHDDYIIWEQTMKYTGELYLPSEVDGGVVTEDYRQPDQTVRLWWSFTPGFGPTKAGEEAAGGFFTFEPIDDLDSWLMAPSTLVPGRQRDSLHIGYYWDTWSDYTTANEWPSNDDTGDPDKVTGHLHSTQVPGFVLLEVIPPGQTTDDITQPYAMPRANVTQHFYGHRTDFPMRDQYIGHGQHGMWPPDSRTLNGSEAPPEKGSMRVMALGPYELTKDASVGRYDSIKVVWAIGVGDVGYAVADSMGKAWFQGQITDEEKNMFIGRGRDSLIQVLDRGNWAWNIGLENVPAPPPPPDIEVSSGPESITVTWSYPSESYYLDRQTGEDDWHAWRVYRKEGAALVDHPDDATQNLQWELVHETTIRGETQWQDTAAVRGVSYYYAVTAVDNGTQNSTGLFPGQWLESSRYISRTTRPAYINYIPVAHADEATTEENTPVNIPVLENDSDADGDVLVIVNVLPSENGRGVFDLRDSTLFYVPKPGFCGIDTIQYIAGDIKSCLDTAEVVITVVPQSISGPQVVWWKTIGGPHGDYYDASLLCSDGGAVVAGTIVLEDGMSREILLVRLNNLGEIVWDKKFDIGESENVYSIVRATDGGYILAVYAYGGDDPETFWLMKVDTTGDLIWIKQYPWYFHRGAFLTQTADDGACLLGSVRRPRPNYDDLMLIRFDASGDTIWTKMFGLDTESNDRGLRIDSRDDGGYLLACHSITRSTGDRIWLITTDASGDIQRTLQIESDDWQVNDIQLVSEGGCILTGRTRLSPDDLALIRVDSSGTTEWTRTFGAPLEGYVGTRVTQTADGGYAVAGYTTAEVPGLAALLIKTDDQGNQAWTRTFGGALGDRASDIFQTDDGGYLAMGNTRSFGAGNGDIWLIRLTPDDGLATTNDWQSELPVTFKLYQNYPNPFNPVSVIRYDIPRDGYVLLIIYDLLGREVASLIDGYHLSGTYEVQWQGRDRTGRELPSGIYIARLAAPAYTQSIKMVLLR